MTIAAGSAALAADPLVTMTAAGALRNHDHSGDAGDGGVLVSPAIYNHAHVGVAGDGGLITTVPANVIAYFNGAVASIPSGWTEFTAARGRVIVGVPLSGTVGGTVGTALTDLQNPTHTHTGPSHQHVSSLDTVNAAYVCSDSPYGTSIAGSNRRLFTVGSITVGASNYENVSAAGTGATGATSATTPYLQQPCIYKQ